MLEFGGTDEVGGGSAPLTVIEIRGFITSLVAWIRTEPRFRYVAEQLHEWHTAGPSFERAIGSLGFRARAAKGGRGVAIRPAWRREGLLRNLNLATRGSLRRQIWTRVVGSLRRGDVTVNQPEGAPPVEVPRLWHWVGVEAALSAGAWDRLGQEADELRAQGFYPVLWVDAPRAAPEAYLGDVVTAARHHGVPVVDIREAFDGGTPMRDVATAYEHSVQLGGSSNRDRARAYAAAAIADRFGGIVAPLDARVTGPLAPATRLGRHGIALAPIGGDQLVLVAAAGSSGSRALTRILAAQYDAPLAELAAEHAELTVQRGWSLEVSQPTYAGVVATDHDETLLRVGFTTTSRRLAADLGAAAGDVILAGAAPFALDPLPSAIGLYRRSTVSSIALKASFMLARSVALRGGVLYIPAAAKVINEVDMLALSGMAERDDAVEAAWNLALTITSARVKTPVAWIVAPDAELAPDVVADSAERRDLARDRAHRIRASAGSLFPQAQLVTDRPADAWPAHITAVASSPAVATPANAATSANVATPAKVAARAPGSGRGRWSVRQWRDARAGRDGTGLAAASTSGVVAVGRPGEVSDVEMFDSDSSLSSVDEGVLGGGLPGVLGRRRRSDSEVDEEELARPVRRVRIDPTVTPVDEVDHDAWVLRSLPRVAPGDVLDSVRSLKAKAAKTTVGFSPPRGLVREVAAGRPPVVGCWGSGRVFRPAWCGLCGGGVRSEPRDPAGAGQLAVGVGAVVPGWAGGRFDRMTDGYWDQPVE